MKTQNEQNERYYQAKLINLRVAPRKVRLVADLVRGLPVSSALDYLKLMTKRSAPAVSKLIRSAMANATEKETIDVDRLIVWKINVDQATSWKRFLPRAQGRASPILKRGCHITVKLREM